MEPTVVIWRKSAVLEKEMAWMHRHCSASLGNLVLFDHHAMCSDVGESAATVDCLCMLSFKSEITTRQQRRQRGLK
jgi:hypothetical protein